MVLRLDTYEKFDVVVEALDQYVQNCWDGATDDTEEVAYTEYPNLKVAEEMLENLNAQRAALAEKR